jgi:hypothetical protein
MNGWATELALYRTNGAFGSLVGSVLRPQGIENASLTAPQVDTHRRRDVFGFTVDVATLRQAWELTLTRESGVDLTADWWLEALAPYLTNTAVDAPTAGYTTTTRVARNDAALPYWNAEVKLADGTCRQLAGMTPSRIEWIVQAGRLVAEQIVFSVLQNLPMADGARLAESARVLRRPVTALQAAHAFKFGSTWNDPAAYRVATFSTQFIFSRDVTPCAFGPDGLATRHEVTGGIELVGKTMVRAPAGFYDQATDAAVDARMWWQFTDPSDPSRTNQIEAQTKAKTGDITLVDQEQIEVTVDWLTVATPSGLFIVRQSKIS